MRNFVFVIFIFGFLSFLLSVVVVAAAAVAAVVVVVVMYYCCGSRSSHNSLFSDIADCFTLKFHLQFRDMLGFKYLQAVRFKKTTANVVGCVSVFFLIFNFFSLGKHQYLPCTKF